MGRLSFEAASLFGRPTLAAGGLYAQTLNLAGIEGELPVGLEGVAMVTHITREEMLRALREQR